MLPELTLIYNNTKDYLSSEEWGFIEKAYLLSKTYHQGQKRKTGEDFVNHPLRVAIELSQLKQDASTIIAGLLHDILEDTNITTDEIKKEFGDEILFWVQGLTKIHSLHHKVKTRQQYHQKKHYLDNLRSLFLAASQDYRIIIIKLMDRLDNMRTIWALNKESQQKNSLETLDIYSPLAYYLGLENIASSLEELAFPYAYPKEYKMVKKYVGKKYLDLEKALIISKRELSDYLNKNNCNFFDIEFRKKKLYSIYRKYLKEKDFNKIYDIIALRIITQNIEDCYLILGFIHQLWLPLPGRLKDYIALPKPNGYRAIHTTTLTTNNQIVEIQIQTMEMYEYSKYGIASHWLYQLNKENKSYIKRKQILKENPLLKTLQTINLKNQDGQTIYNIFVNELLKEQIFVLTPKGDVINLPKGSTPIDFAYKIHSDLGNHCQMAKVNNQIVPLNYQLQSGDIVEIITNKNKKPNREWMKFTKIKSTKRKILDNLE